jgi:hypothetical protein
LSQLLAAGRFVGRGGLTRINPAEIALEHPPRQLRKGPGQFQARRVAADHDDAHEPRFFRLDQAVLRSFKRQQDLPPGAERAVERLEAGRV